MGRKAVGPRSTWSTAARLPGKYMLYMYVSGPVAGWALQVLFKKTEIFMIPAFPRYLLTRTNRGFFAILVIIYALFVGSGAAHAAQANLAWNANPQPEVAGYMVHYGQVSGAYTNKVDVGKVTTYTIAGLLDGRTYYYAVTA
jgi:hypothetical protein